MIRITRKGGLILIYVWALEQDGKKFAQQDVLIPWHLQFKFEDEDKVTSLLKDKECENQESKEEFKQKTGEEDDIILNESKKSVVYKRYYHMFKYGELEDLIKACPQLEIVDSNYDHANWVVKCKKIQ